MAARGVDGLDDSVVVCGIAGEDDDGVVLGEFTGN